MRVRRRDAPTSHQGHSPGEIQKFSVGTEPTLSLPMLVDHGNRLVYRGGGHDVEHGSRRSRTVDVRWRRMVPEGAGQEQQRVHTY